MIYSTNTAQFLAKAKRNNTNTDQFMAKGKKKKKANLKWPLSLLMKTFIILYWLLSKRRMMSFRCSVELDMMI